jgi:hypothetical protein
MTTHLRRNFPVPQAVHCGDFVQVIANRKPLWLKVQIIVGDVANCIALDAAGDALQQVPFDAILSVISADQER